MRATTFRVRLSPPLYESHVVVPFCGGRVLFCVQDPCAQIAERVASQCHLTESMRELGHSAIVHMESRTSVLVQCGTVYTEAKGTEAACNAMGLLLRSEAHSSHAWRLDVVERRLRRANELLEVLEARLAGPNKMTE